MKLAEDTRMFLAIISLGLGVFGIFYLGLFLGPFAIACSVLALYTPPRENTIATTYRICAFFGLLIGILSVILGTMVALEWFGLVEFGIIE